MPTTPHDRGRSNTKKHKLRPLPDTHTYVRFSANIVHLFYHQKNPIPDTLLIDPISKILLNILFKANMKYYVGVMNALVF